MSEAATVTVLIPARNEEADIEACLRAVLAQNHPQAQVQVVLVDGGSTDRTRSVAVSILQGGGTVWTIVDNPTGTTPSNLNAGLAAASGTYLCRVDARSVVPEDYVRTCVDVLERRPEVSVVGGAQVAVAPTTRARALGIARALNNRFAMGGARYRSGAASGPADTVYLGAFRTAELRAEGGWDDVFATNQDYDLNRRMAQRGIVWFDDRLRVGYVPRSTLRRLWTQYHRFGRWKVRYWRRSGDRPQHRQMVLIVLAPLVAISAATLLVAARTSLRRAVVVAGSAAVLFSLEDRGSSGPAAGVVSRSISVVAMLTVASGWVSGVWRELVVPAR